MPQLRDLRRRRRRAAHLTSERPLAPASTTGRSLVVEGLERRLGATAALRGVSFELSSGGLALLLGPNGAGKTTLLRVLAGYLVPDAGSVRLVRPDGACDPGLPGCRRLIGYLPEGAPLYGDMSVLGVLVHLGRARGLTARRARDRAERLTGELSLGALASRSVRTLSRGERQRVGIAQALVADPAFVLLDEPTTGLDPHEADRAWSLIADEARHRVVLCSTHSLDRPLPGVKSALVMDSGRLVAAGPPEALGHGSLGEAYRDIVERARRC